MKKVVIIIIITILILGIAGAGAAWFFFNKLVDKSGEVVDNFLDSQQQLMEKLEAGKITEEEFAAKMEKLSGQMEKAAEKSQGSFGKIPAWFKETGIPEPKGLTLDQKRSKQTSIHNPNERIDSIELVYTGDYSVLRAEAERLAKAANVPAVPGSDLIAEQMVTYASMKDDDAYLMAISADKEEGTLTITASNTAQMKKVLHK